jgi:hypothetical protein
LEQNLKKNIKKNAFFLSYFEIKKRMSEIEKIDDAIYRLTYFIFLISNNWNMNLCFSIKYLPYWNKEKEVCVASCNRISSYIASLIEIILPWICLLNKLNINTPISEPLDLILTRNQTISFCEINKQSN